MGKFLTFVLLLSFVANILCGITTNKTHVINLATIGSWGTSTSMWSNPMLSLARFAAWMINNQTAILPDVELNLVIGNCGSGAGNPSNCLLVGTDMVRNQSITGFLTGPYTNDQRILQFVANAFNIPHVSGIASGNILSNKNSYPTLVRTSTPDSLANYVMIDYMVQNGWTHAAVPMEDQDWGAGNRDALQVYAAERGITLFFVVCPIGDNDFTTQVNLIKATGYRVIITILLNRESWIFLNNAKQAGLVGPDYVWMVSISGVLAMSTASMNQAQGLLPFLNITELRPYFDGVIGILPHGGEGEKFDQIFPVWNAMSSQFPATRPVPGYYWFMYDAVEAFAISIDAMIRNGTDLEDIKQTALLHKLWEMDFQGVTGRNVLDENHDRIATIDMVNFNATHQTIARQYDPIANVYNEVTPIRFYGGRTDPPIDTACGCIHGTCTRGGGCNCLPGYVGSMCDVEQSKSGGSGISTGGLVGAIVGSVVAVAVVIFIILIFFRRKHNYLVLELTNKQQSDIPRGEIKLMKKIGYGAAGEVYTALFRGTEVAVKRLLPKNVSASMIQEFKMETAIMCALRHPKIHIVLFMGSCYDSTSQEMLLLMEYMNKGSLYSVLHDKSQSLPISLQLHLAYQIASGINFLHQCNPAIIHCDIKSHNVLLDRNWNARISDFGITKLKKISGSNKQKGNDDDSSNPIGTIYWASPEVLNGESQSKASDCYAFGVVLWELFHRRIPYDGMSPINVAINVANDGVRPIINSNVPEPVVDLITKCWAKNPSARPDFEAITTAIRTIMMGENSLSSNEDRMLDQGAPTGVVFFVATDVLNGNGLWADPKYEMRSALVQHNQIMREHLTTYHGYEVHFKDNGFLMAFALLEDAVNWAITVQQSLLQAQWSPVLTEHASASVVKSEMGSLIWNGLRVRMGINKGTPTYKRDPNSDKIYYEGLAVEKALKLAVRAPAGMALITDEIQEMLKNRTSSFMNIMEKVVTQECSDNTFTLVPKGLEQRFEENTEVTGADHPYMVIDVDVATPYSPSKPVEVRRPDWMIDNAALGAQREIGKSLVANVFKSTLNDAEVAVKSPYNQKFSERDILDIKYTISIISSFNHPNILKCVGLTTQPLSLVFEFMSNGTLRDFYLSSASIAFSEKVRILRDIACGLKDVFIGKSREVKVGDFALNEIYDLLKTLTSVEAAAWMAPEMFGGKQGATIATSIYSFGIMMWEVYCRKLPYDKMHPMKLINKIVAGYRPETPVDCPTAYKNLMELCWDGVPEKRPSWDYIINTFDSM